MMLALLLILSPIPSQLPLLPNGTLIEEIVSGKVYEVSAYLPAEKPHYVLWHVGKPGMPIPIATTVFTAAEVHSGQWRAFNRP